MSRRIFLSLSLLPPEIKEKKNGWPARLGFVSRNASRNTRGRVQGEVLLVPLISCSNEATAEDGFGRGLRT